MTERRTGPREGRSNVEVTTADTKSIRQTSDIPQQLRRRRDASDRLPPMEDGRRDPIDPPTRHRCFECGKDLRLARFHRIDAKRIVCRRCWRDRWAPR
jgi:hypothetical protein